MINAAAAFSTVDDATTIYGTPTEQRYVRRDHLPQFDPATETTLRAMPAKKQVAMATWRRSCWSRGDETLIVVFEPETRHVIAAKTQQTLWH